MEIKDEQAKVPFYMTFPMQNLYLMEMEYEKDMERMKLMYPKEVRSLMPYIEERCDELEYEGSRIYDENPDRIMIEEEIQKLYEKILAQEPQAKGGETIQSAERSRCVYTFTPPEGLMVPVPRSRELSGTDMGPGGHRGPGGPHGHGGHGGKKCDNWMCGMVGVLFWDELYRRRCRHRRCHRWW